MEKTKKSSTMNKALMMGTALVSLGALNAQEAQAATGTGAMSAIVLAPIVVTNVQALHFGEMTRGAGGTMVVTTTTGARTATGVSAVTGSGLEQQGIISIAADTGTNVDLAVTATSFTVVNGTAQTMVVDNFNIVSDAGGTAQTVTLPASPTSFNVGATLNVGAAQASGTYTGAYTLSANYQ